MNFSSPISQSPSAIPQMNAPPLPPPPTTFNSFNNQPPPPPSPNSSSFGALPGSAYQQWIQSRQQKIGPQQEQQTQQQLPTQSPGGGGLKPIRFQLQPKRGKPTGGGGGASQANNPNFYPLGGFGNDKSGGYDDDSNNSSTSNFMNDNRKGESGNLLNQPQSWSQRSALLPTPLQKKYGTSSSPSASGSPPHNLTQQQIINAMNSSDWPPSLQ
jgi:hypothetical protein